MLYSLERPTYRDKTTLGLLTFQRAVVLNCGYENPHCHSYALYVTEAYLGTFKVDHFEVSRSLSTLRSKLLNFPRIFFSGLANGRTCNCDFAKPPFAELLRPRRFIDRAVDGVFNRPFQQP